MQGMRAVWIACNRGLTTVRLHANVHCQRQLIGDALCAMAGWLKLPWRGVLLWMGLGKLVRFIVATAFLLWVPDGFWQALLQRIF